MTHDDHESEWNGPHGPDPHDPAPHDPEPLSATWAHEWLWDEDNLMHAEYIGVPLYLQLRDRLQSIRVPEPAQNLLMLCLIDSYDNEALDHGVPCATMVTTHDTDHNMVRLDIHGPDQVPPLFRFNT